LLLQRRSTRASCGSFVPSLVATRPRRNMTRSPAGRVGCKDGEAGFVGCPGFEEGEVGGGAGPGFGEGAGLGGFCAQTIGVKRRNRRASSTRMRVRGLMSCLLRVSERGKLCWHESRIRRSASQLNCGSADDFYPESGQEKLLIQGGRCVYGEETRSADGRKPP
jgi:hypothetical protein